MLTPTTPDGSSLRLFFDGPVGVTGDDVTQSIDLTSLPKATREDASFEDNFVIFVVPGAGITDINPEVEFADAADGLPGEMIFTLDSDSVDNNINLTLWYLHSVTR